MDLGIAGKAALVCAASKGLGRGCAMALAGEGVDVTIVARTPGPLEATAEEIRKGCGVTVLDAPEEVLPAAMAYTGKSPVSVTNDDLEAAGKTVLAARPSYRYIHSSSYINDLANGAVCVAQGYAGDLFQARKRAQEAKNGIEIGIFLPKEGAAFNIDVMAIPKDAPHPDNAYKFINYLLSPKVVADITAAVGYANAVPASLEHVPAEIRNDPVVFPPQDAKLYTPVLATPAYERARNRLWTRIKAGK